MRDGGSKCPWLPFLGVKSLDVQALRVVDDPRLLCKAWHTGSRPDSVRPIWLVRSAQARLAAMPVLPPSCVDGHSGQCLKESPQLRWCALPIERAVVLPSGLIVNGSHRFNLASSHQFIDEPWRRSEHQLDGWCKHRMPPRRRLWSFRQLYANTALHSLFQVLPLLALALDDIERDENATVLAPSAMFKVFAQNVLPRGRIMLSATAVAAESVHLVVGHPTFSPLYHHFARACLRRFRYPAPPLPPVTAPGALVLFLPRGSGAGSRHGVRDFGAQQEELVAVTRASVARHGAGARLELFRFESLQQQHASFRDAQIVVGPQGTAFSGLAFCRTGVQVIEWALRRDEDWAVLEYFDLHADYYQLMPRWSVSQAIPDCNATHIMDDCPWYLDSEDVELYVELLGAILQGDGPAAKGVSNKLSTRTYADQNAEIDAFRVPLSRTAWAMPAHRPRSSSAFGHARNLTTARTRSARMRQRVTTREEPRTREPSRVLTKPTRARL